ncbi:MAG TPA: hypothetical protein DCE56_17735 [Cyanobacteria bacterium UBA8553]|nr:hypothetical protein [Cyanobacteria bacterium UBA8553]HAJ62028.1 hypothetical protein [Cyanobacteria bacterium UBA8543]
MKVAIAAALKILFQKQNCEMFPKSFSKIVVATALALPIVSFNIDRALADDKRDFSIINNTSTALDALYISASGSNNWGDNVLEKSIPSGDSADLHYTGNSSDCLFDIKGVFSDGVETDERQVDFCKVGTYTFHDEDQQPQDK